MIKLEIFAKDIQNKLEDISINLQENDFPQFNITDEIQIYKNQNIKKNGRRFTPGILRAIPGAITPESNWGVYIGNYQLEIYGYREEREIIKDIFREFSRENNGVEYIPELGCNFVENGRIGILSAGELIFDEFLSSDDGADEGRFHAYLDITFSVFVGGLSAKETGLRIEGVDIPVDEVQYKQDKSLISNIEFSGAQDSPNINNKLIYELLTFNVPLNVSPKADALIMSRALMPTYNDLFYVEWDLGIGIKEGHYTLRSAFIQYNQMNEAIGILLSFENVVPVSSVKIDGETLPIIRFNFTSVRGTKSLTDADEIGPQILFVPTHYNYAISMVLLFDQESEVARNLYSEIVTNTSEVSHKIEIDAFDDEVIEYDVILTEGSIEYDERANQTLIVSFVGEKII